LEKRLHQLSLLLQIFCANFPGSVYFVLLNTWDGNAALFANVLCNIPILLKVKLNSELWMEIKWLSK